MNQFFELRNNGNIFKKIIGKLVGWIVEPAYEELEKLQAESEDIRKKNSAIQNELVTLQKDVIQTVQHEVDIFKSDIAELTDRADDSDREIKNALLKIEKYDEDQAEKLSAMAREIMRTKWKLKDDLNSKSEDEEEEVTCIVCNHKVMKKDAEKKISTCMFAGGVLERYVCPNCGCIFGPTKFSSQSKEEYDDDYIIHYLGFKEADSTEGEKETFFLLNPTKEGIYLNYGCGKWAQTIDELRAEGYNVYGFDLYATDISNPYIINDLNVIKKMRFDGIFSHDLLEHLMNPVKELLFMKSLMKSPESKMAHSTACYEYKYEFTRFHTCFYTGNSVQLLCQKANLKIENYVDDGNKKDFMCYVFGIEDKEISFMEEMGAAETEDGAYIAENGSAIYGPYFKLIKGDYHLLFDIEVYNIEARLLVTAELGKKIITSYQLSNGLNKISLKLTEDCDNIEFVIQTQQGQKVVLKNAAFIN